MESRLWRAAAVSLFTIGIAASGPTQAQSAQGQSAQQSSQGGQSASTGSSGGNASAGQSSPRDLEQRSGDDDSGNWGWLGLLGLIGLAGLRRRREEPGRTSTTAGGPGVYNR